MKPILFFSSDRRPSTTAKISGVYRFAQSTGWNVQVVDLPDQPETVAQLLEFWNPLGCIVECGRIGIPRFTEWFSRIPVVYLDADIRKIGRKCDSWKQCEKWPEVG